MSATQAPPVPEVAQDPTWDAFSIASSRVVTIALALTLTLLCGVGALVPQGVTREVLARSLSPSLMQAVAALELHHVLTAWPTLLIGALLVLNVMGRWLRSRLELEITPTSADEGRQHLLPETKSTLTSAEALTLALPRWSIRRLDPGCATAETGLVREGWWIAALGTTGLLGALAYAQLAGANGELRIVTGAFDDPSAIGRTVAQRNDGDVSVPWRPGFDVRCQPSASGRPDGLRQCLVLQGGSTFKVDMEPGRDVEVGDLRITLTGVRRRPEIPGFDVVVTSGDSRTVLTGSVAVPLDVGGDASGIGRLATLVLTGAGAEDPVLVYDGSPTGPAPGDLKVMTLPREELTFRLATTTHAPWVFGALTLLVLGLGLALVWPSAQVRLERTGTSGWRLTVTPRTFTARVEHLVGRVSGALGAVRSP